MKTHLLKRYSVNLINASLVVLFAWSLAQWTWTFFSPKSTVVLAHNGLPLNQASTAIIKNNLFGSANPSVAPTKQTSLNIKLKGILAMDGDSASYGIFQLSENNAITVPIGGQIRPNLTLEAIYPDYALLKHDNILEKLPLTEKSPAPSNNSVASRPPSNQPSSQPQYIPPSVIPKTP